MQTLENQELVSRRRGWLRCMGYGTILAALALAGVWLGTRHRERAKPATEDPMSAMGGMASPVNAPPADVSGASAELQIDLATDELKKAQIRTARVTKGVTAAKLRVPGLVKPNEYREVH